MKKNNLLKEKYRYNASGELGNAPIHTAENCRYCDCGEITRDLAEFAEEQKSPDK